jgi:hypothetical protein
MDFGMAKLKLFDGLVDPECEENEYLKFVNNTFCCFFKFIGRRMTCDLIEL